MEKVPLFSAALLLLTACGSYPRDMAGTSERIASSGTIRVGLVKGTDQAAEVSQFLGELAKRTDAHPILTSGSAEPLLVDLDAGRIDLVIGEMSKKTPWLTEAAIVEPLKTRKVREDEVTLSAIARNGENRWVITLEQVVRDLKDKPA